MSTALPFDYAHTTRYFSKGIDDRGPYYKVEYLIDDWTISDAFVNDLLGNRSITGTALTSITPHQHPLSPNLWCCNAEVVEGLDGPATNANGYPIYNGGALVRAEYRAPTFDYVSQPQNSFDPTTEVLWATQELDYGCEVYTTPGNNFKFTAGPENGQPTGIPGKQTIPITTLSLTFERLPYLAMSLTRSLRFRVNSVTFLGSSAGLVMFKGSRTTRQWNTDGSVCQKTQFIFAERDSAYPWNALPSKTNLAWYPIQDKYGNSIYPTADLTPLVQLF